jgi:hypothetical protein
MTALLLLLLCVGGGGGETKFDKFVFPFVELIDNDVLVEVNEIEVERADELVE